jgi:hypothetical protein
MRGFKGMPFVPVAIEIDFVVMRVMELDICILPAVTAIWANSRQQHRVWMP